MSKAFLRETDMPDLPEAPPPVLPPGTRNYLTAYGAQRLREELTRLLETERPPLIAVGNDSDAKLRLHRVDQRIRYLEQSLRTAEVVEAAAGSAEEVRFGATVTVRDPAGDVSTYRIVGVDEIDPDRGWISWLSPLARALMGAKAGQQVAFRSPAGPRDLTVCAIAYE